MDAFLHAGQFVKERREQLGLSQADITNLLQKKTINISRAVFSRLEAGQGGQKHWGDAKFIDALAEILEVSPVELRAVLGLIDRLDIDISTLRFLELISKMDARQREKAEQILRILLDEQNREKAEGPQIRR